DMRKSELVARVADTAGVAKREAEKVLDAFFDTARKAAKKGDQVSWPKFGVVAAAKKAGKSASAKKGAAKQAVTNMVETVERTVEKVVHHGGATEETSTAGVPAVEPDATSPMADDAPPV